MAVIKPELLAPAGSLEKLKIAIKYGADAVYAGGQQYGLRTFAENLSVEDFKAGCEFAHKNGAKVYITLNSMAHDAEFEGLADFAAEVSKAGVDGAIISDPGVFMTVKNACPKLELHVSTQANIVNSASCRLWHDIGASRVVLARELCLDEIKKIRAQTPSELELEAFVHGAMCVSVSGRCLISNYLTGRDSNRGSCTQPCRWEYHLMEEKRPGEYFKVEEDEKGTFFFNSKDMCMIKRIPDLISAGITSFKIEGRVKSEFYVATVVSAYRRAIDAYMSDPQNYVFDETLYDELCKVSHRTYFEGFIDGYCSDSQIYGTSSYERGYEYSAMVEAYDSESGLIECSQRNKITQGDELEVISPDRAPRKISAQEIYDSRMERVDSTPHAKMKYFLKVPFEIEKDSMLRKKII